jgi:PEGA domain
MLSNGDEPAPAVATADPVVLADAGAGDTPIAAPTPVPDPAPAADPAPPPTPAPAPQTPAPPTPARPTPAPAAPAPISVAFASSPEGASVSARIDGRTRELCVTPCTAALPAGSVEIEVRRSGFDTKRRTLEVKAGASLEVSLDKRRERSRKKPNPASVAKEGDLLNPF